MKMSQFYIETFGCQMNSLDSEKVAGLLTARGMQKAARIQDADVVFFNTCSVREKAHHKVLSRLGELKPLKRKKPDLIVGVLGCVAQQEGKKLIKKAGIIDIVTGPQKLHRIPAMVDQVIEEGGPIIETHFEKGPMPVEVDAILRESAFRANVTIQEGCDKFCTFCIVPYTRGREKNRPSRAILNEIRRLADHGYVEVILLGQNVNSYRDPSSRALAFHELLSEVGQVPGIRRVRFTSPHPSDFNEKTLKVINETPSICNQLHLPLQSGSNRVLASMNRGYTREEYLEKVRMAQDSPRSISISTDLIVGYPGEREEDLEDTLDLMTRVRYHQVYSFVYSPRPLTAAKREPDDIPLVEKKRRLEILQKLQKEIQFNINQRYLQDTLEVLVEGPSRTGRQLMGRTSENVCVNFEAPTNEPCVGKFMKVHIQEAHAHSLKGEWVG